MTAHVPAWLLVWVVEGGNLLCYPPLLSQAPWSLGFVGLRTSAARVWVLFILAPSTCCDKDP